MANREEAETQLMQSCETAMQRQNQRQGSLPAGGQGGMDVPRSTAPHSLRLSLPAGGQGGMDVPRSTAPHSLRLCLSAVLASQVEMHRREILGKMVQPNQADTL